MRKRRDVAAVEPMRPVRPVAVPKDSLRRRKDLSWRLFFLLLFGAQALLIVGFDISYWWAFAVGLVALVCFEGSFWIAERRRNKQILRRRPLRG